MAKYQVRKGFVVHLERSIYTEGRVLELSEEQYLKVAHQLEPIVEKSAKASKEA